MDDALIRKKYFFYPFIFALQQTTKQTFFTKTPKPQNPKTPKPLNNLDDLNYII